MDAWTVKIFIEGCMTYGRYGYLNLDNQELTCFYKECLIMARYLEASSTILAILNLILGGLHEKMFRFPEALTFYEEAQKYAAKENDKLVEGHALALMGKTYISLGKYLEAIDYHEKSMKIASEIGNKESEARSCTDMAAAYNLLHRYDKAIKYFEKSLMIFTEKGDKKEEGFLYVDIGNTYFSSGKYHEAIKYYEKSLKIVTETGYKKGEGTAWMNLGNAYWSLGTYHEALKYYKKSLSVVVEIGDKKGEGNTCMNLGNAYLSSDEYPEAIKYYEKSLKIAIEISDKRGEGITYVNLGNAYFSLGKYHEAIKYYEQSLNIVKKIGYTKGEGTIHMNIGSVYQSLGNYQEAIKHYEKSLNIAIEIGDKKGEGTVYMNLGKTYISLGKFKEGKTFYEESLSIAIETGDKKEEGNIYTNFGNAYLSLGKYHEAIEYEEKGLRIAIEIGDRKGEGASYISLGNAYRKLGKFGDDIKCYEKSLKIAIELCDKKGEGTTYVSLGNTYLLLGKYSEAIKYAEKGLRIAKEMGNKELEGANCISLGNAYHKLEKYNEAIRYCKKSLNIATEVGDKRMEAIANNNLGASYYHLSIINKKSENNDDVCKQTKQQSLDFLRESLRCWDWLFHHLQKQDDFKISIVDTFVTTYKLLTLVLIDTLQIEEALLVCDRGRARALGDLLISKYGITEENPFRNTQLKYADVETVSLNCNACILFFALLYKRGLGIWVSTQQRPLIFFEYENEGFNPTSHTVQFKNDQKRSMALRFTKVVNDAYEKMKIGQGVRCENRSLDSPENPQQIKSDEPDTTDESSLSSDKRNKTPVEDDQKGSEEDTDPLEILFNILVAPVLHNLEQEEIVIIPEGPLYKVPFVALRNPATGLFLSETKCIRLASSLNTLKVLQECLADCHCKTGALIIGDPFVGEVMFRGEKRIFKRLPSAEHEAKIIGGILNAKPLIGSQATKEMIKQNLQKGVAVIHIAAHGSSEGGQIALAPTTQTEAGSIPEEQDYMLTMKEVQEIGVRAQLVVLSCCHSGRGEIKSEGVVGMSRAFLAAGARAVVASLWAIDDDATLSFMVSFYTYLKMGQSASKSLQQAMKEIREEGYSEPKYWAPFFLIGDDVTISY